MMEAMRDFRRGQRNGWAAPRGNSKSTMITFIKALHRIVYKLENFIVIISETEKQATDRVMEIKNELEHNEMLKEVYGNLKGSNWLKQDFTTANDVRVVGFASRSAIRGIRHRNFRPTWVIFDDIENRKAVKSGEQRADLMDWFKKDPGKCGVVGHTNFEIVGTMLHVDSLLANVFKNPGWKCKLYRAVIEWPTAKAQAYWDRWKEIVTDLTNEDREEEAEQYYRTYETEMMEGVKTLWPEWEPFIELQKTLVFEGKASFNTEKQNNPVNPDTAVFNMENALFCQVDQENDQIVRRDGRVAKLSKCKFFGYLDPAFGKTVEGDWAAIVVIAVDGWGYVYVVDVWIRRQPTSDQIRAAFEMGARWNLTAFGLEVNNGWELLIDDFETEANLRKKRGEYYSLRLQRVHNTQNKTDRIASLEPKVDNRWVGFADHLAREFMEQMEQFPTSHHDDGPDALEGAIRVASEYVTLFGGVRQKEAA